jgi:hypothetical protein
MDIEAVEKARQTIKETRTLLHKSQTTRQASERILRESRNLILKATITNAKAEKTMSLFGNLLTQI